jgi:hypothetical protein
VTHTLLNDFGATFSPCRKWRYRLWRILEPDAPRLLFCMMNPSTADEVRNDPTIERCVRRVLRWQKQGLYFGAVEIVNVFAWRETDSKRLPQLLAAGVDIVGPENDAAIRAAALEASAIVCGWGQPGNIGGRGAHVLEILRSTDRRLHALGINADGTPQHPLYIGYDAPLVDLG